MHSQVSQVGSMAPEAGGPFQRQVSKTLTELETLIYGRTEIYAPKEIV